MVHLLSLSPPSTRDLSAFMIRSSLKSQVLSSIARCVSADTLSSSQAKRKRGDRESQATRYTRSKQAATLNNHEKESK